MSRYWLRRCPVQTHFYDALSTLFPAWESLFVEVVLAHLPHVHDPELRRRMQKFVAQETAHKTAHHAHNKRIGSLSVEQGELDKVAVARRRPRMRVWLAAMVSIEHIAACLSRHILTEFNLDRGREFSLFRWHAVEELEHKSLAIDLWDYLGYPRKELRSTAMRNLRYVTSFCWGYTVQQLKADGILTKPKTYRKLLGVAWVWATRIVMPYTALLRKDFHPDHVDDSALILRYA